MEESFKGRKKDKQVAMNKIGKWKVLTNEHEDAISSTVIMKYG